MPSLQATRPPRAGNIVDRAERLRQDVRTSYPAWPDDVVDVAVGVLIVHMPRPQLVAFVSYGATMNHRIDLSRTLARCA